MDKYKYMAAEDAQGVTVTRGDFVMAFVPDNSGKRRVMEAEVVAINAKTIRVKYYWNGKPYTTNVPERYWASFNAHIDDLRDKDEYIKELKEIINELKEKLNG
jgi:hypothetical protein